MSMPRGANAGRELRPDTEPRASQAKRRARVAVILAIAAVPSTTSVAVAQDRPIRGPEAATAPDVTDGTSTVPAGDEAEDRPPKKDSGADAGASKKKKSSGRSSSARSASPDGSSEKPDKKPRGEGDGLVTPAQGGNDQYQPTPDPPGNNPPPSNDGGPSVGSSGVGSAGSSGTGGTSSSGGAVGTDGGATGSSQPQGTTPPAAAAPGSSGGQLPATGVDARVMALAGALMAAMGLAMRRSLRLR